MSVRPRRFKKFNRLVLFVVLAPLAAVCVSTAFVQADQKERLKIDSIYIAPLFIGTKHSGYRVTSFGHEHVTEFEYRPSIGSEDLVLWKVRVRPFAIFYSAGDLTQSGFDPNCSVKSQSGKSEALITSALELSEHLKTGCSLEDALRLRESIAQIFTNKPSEPRYLSCLQKLDTRFVEVRDAIDVKKESLPDKKESLSCIERIPESESKSAKFDERGTKISITNAALRSASQQKLNELVFHEYLHLGGLNESDVKDVAACCNKPFDLKSDDCKKLLPQENLKDFLNGRASGEGKREAAPRATSRAEKSRDNRKSNSYAAEQTANPSKLSSNRSETVGEEQAKGSLYQQLTKDIGKRLNAVEPIHRLAKLQMLPRAEAASEVLAADTHVVPIVDDNYRRGSSPKTPDSEPDDGIGKQVEKSESRRIEISESRSITPSSVETRITGFDKKTGAPKLQLPDGTTIPSFTAFASLTSNANQPSAATASAITANTDSANQANILVNAGRPAPARAVKPAGEAKLAGSTDNGGSSGGGGGESGFGIQRSIAAERNTGRARSGRSSGGEPVFTSVDLKPRAHSTDDLKNVPIKTSGDAMRVIKAADEPRTLIRQKWFEDRLKGDDLRIQIYDGTNKPVGSENPRIRWNLPYLLREQSP